MPVIFSPGEPETRPLNPEAIVYTTAQKVADLLGIGPGEAVLASADTVANAVFVTGADYRNHGFSVGDSILVYSDAYPIGFTAEIDTIVSGGNNGVKLNLKDINSSGSATIATHVDLTDVAVADNTYIQNTASFTNGKTRGMKRSTVEERIKEVQDRIDSASHNAWRPYLVSSEYINFDTYKPYRRRYYTDYVGTTPLLFRNVQQIIKLEVWQGEKYRELAGTNATIKIHQDQGGPKDNNLYFGLPNGSVSCIHPSGQDTLTWTTVTAAGTGYSNASGLSAGGGSGTGMVITISATGGAVTSVTVTSAGSGYVSGDTLTIPTGGTNAKFRIYVPTNNINAEWSTEFQDTVHTHQELADTINQEDRANKVAIPFAPRFTLPGSSSNVTLKDEFMAVANSDYGNGILHLTSMRQTKGGGLHTVITNSGTNENISDVETVTGYCKFKGPLISATITNDAGGGSYSAGNVASTASTGSGSATLTITVATALDGSTTVNGITAVHTAGNSHAVGDVLTFGSGGFTATVTAVSASDSLFFTDENGVASSPPSALTSGVMRLSGSGFSPIVAVNNVSIASAISISGLFSLYDNLPPSYGGEVVTITQHRLTSDIGQYSDAGGDQARLKDWWLDHEMGIIYFNNSYPFFEWNAVKCSYIYGERYVEKAIEEAATKLVAADLLMSDDRSVLVPEGSQNVDLGAKIQLYRKEAEEILKRYKEMVVFA